METDKDSLFDHMGVSYDEFGALEDEQKMEHIREYSRGWLKEGEGNKDVPWVLASFPASRLNHIHTEKGSPQRFTL